MSTSVHGRYGVSVRWPLLVGAACSRTPAWRHRGAGATCPGRGAPLPPMLPARSPGMPSPRFPIAVNCSPIPPTIVRRDGAYTWHRAEAQRSIRAARDRRWPPAPDHAVRPVAGLQVRPPRRACIGRLDLGRPSQPATPSEQTILTFGAHAAFGSIAQPEAPPLRLTVRNGVELAGGNRPERSSPRINNAATRPTRPDFRVPPKTAPVASHRRGTQMAAAAPATAAAGVVHHHRRRGPGLHARLRRRQRRHSRAVTRLNYLVDVANTAYTNSEITPSVRLVDDDRRSPTRTTQQQQHAREADRLRLDHQHIRRRRMPAFNALRAAREQYGADLVSLVRSFRDPENDGCGIAWLIGGGQSGISDQRFVLRVFGRQRRHRCRNRRPDLLLPGRNARPRTGPQHGRGARRGNVQGRRRHARSGGLRRVFRIRSATRRRRRTGNFYTIMAYGDCRPDASTASSPTRAARSAAAAPAARPARPTMPGRCRRRSRPSRHSGLPPVSPFPPACC